jgi:hypothetical protein
MSKRLKPPFINATKFEDRNKFVSVCDDICNRWNVSEYPDIKQAVLSSLIDLNDVVHVFLEKVQEIEAQTPVRLSDHAVPPRIFYERIEEERKRLISNPEALEALDGLDEIENKRARCF